MSRAHSELFKQLQTVLETDETDEAVLLKLAIGVLKAKSTRKPRRQPSVSATQLKTLKYLASKYPIQSNRRSYTIVTPDGPWKVMPNTLQKLQALGFVAGLHITDKGEQFVNKSS